VLLSDSKQNKLTAYSAQTGHQVWTAQDTASSDSPIATRIGSHGKTVYWATTRLYAYDAQGRAVWPIGIANSQDGNFHAVVADDTTVYAASTASLSENVIAAYRADDGAPLWRTSWPKDSRPSPALECMLVLSGGKLYVGDHINGVLIALDAKTGETLWQFHDPAGAGVNINWQIVANDQYVFAGYGTTVHGFKAD
jgi:outer membrane protein assembly factor BamB